MSNMDFEPLTRFGIPGAENIAKMPAKPERLGLPLLANRMYTVESQMHINMYKSLQYNPNNYMQDHAELKSFQRVSNAPPNEAFQSQGGTTPGSAATRKDKAALQQTSASLVLKKQAVVYVPFLEPNTWNSV